ncbi:unnamed protein product [Adineta ricciae]|uniref:Uncharacterized protein n=1 Tax=Adineta ricciae TaxID=249248 RepID=A0A815WLF5_ADIRI|nr:unnamed protein product [Adineta ricciae]
MTLPFFEKNDAIEAFQRENSTAARLLKNIGSPNKYSTCSNQFQFITNNTTLQLQSEIMKISALFSLLAFAFIGVQSIPLRHEENLSNHFGLPNEIESFLGSLNAQQRSWWTSIRDNVVNPVLAGAAIVGASAIHPSLGTATAIGLGKLVNPVLAGAAIVGASAIHPSLGTATAIGLGKRELNTEVENEIESFLGSLNAQQRSWWTSIRDKVVNPVLAGAAIVGASAIHPSLGTATAIGLGKRELDGGFVSVVS